MRKGSGVCVICGDPTPRYRRTCGDDCYRENLRLHGIEQWKDRKREGTQPRHSYGGLCKRGHRLTQANTKIVSGGGRTCLKCYRLRVAERFKERYWSDPGYRERRLEEAKRSKTRAMQERQNERRRWLRVNDPEWRDSQNAKRRRPEATRIHKRLRSDAGKARIAEVQADG